MRATATTGDGGTESRRMAKVPQSLSDIVLQYPLSLILYYYLFSKEKLKITVKII